MPRTSDLNVDDLVELLQVLEDGGVREVSLDLATLNLPGVWVNVAGFAADLLAGLTIQTQLVCLTGDKDPLRALRKLQPLFNTVMAALAPLGGPTGDPATGVWQLPTSSTPMPGISIPFDLLTTQEP